MKLFGSILALAGVTACVAQGAGASVPSASPLAIPKTCRAPMNDFPFCDTSLPQDTRIKDLVSRLEVDDIPPILTARVGEDYPHNGSVPRIGLAAYDWGANCVHGVQSRCSDDGRCPTAFSNPNGLGATFNMSGVQEMGSVIGVELRALWLNGVGENHDNNQPHVGLDCWSPNINIVRDPRWGRNMETPGEDPGLSGLYAVAYTWGQQYGEDPRYLQGITTIKHWAAYSVDNYKGMNRYHFDALVSPYDLGSTYFPAFRAGVMQGNAQSLMCSYNELNGVPACLDPYLLETVLRQNYGFSGAVSSDSGAINFAYNDHGYAGNNSYNATAIALESGCDINSGQVYGETLAALINGTGAGSNIPFDADSVSTALYNVFKARMDLGLMDPADGQPYYNVPMTSVQSDAHVAASQHAARESMVLLKNEASVLPLSKGTNVALVGPHAITNLGLLGNYLGQACPGYWGDWSCVATINDTVTATNGAAHTTTVQGTGISYSNGTNIPGAVAAARDADVVVMALGLYADEIEGEMLDRINITLPAIQLQLLDAVVAVGKPVVVVLVNGGAVAVDGWVDSVHGLVEAWYPGVYGAQAVADVLFGDYNPGGKLPVTMYKADFVEESDYLSMSMTQSPGRTYRYFTGEPTYPFGYGLSYTTFKVSTSAPTTVGPATTTTRGSATTPHFTLPNTGVSTLHTTALKTAATAHGARDPNGMFFLDDHMGVVDQARNTVRVRATHPDPAALWLSDDEIAAASPSTGALSFQVTVTNTGDVAGDEVMQAYAKPTNASNPMLQYLWGFKRVHLEAGQSAEVSYTLTPVTFASMTVDATTGATISSPGKFSVFFSTDGGVTRVGEMEVEVVGDVEVLHDEVTGEFTAASTTAAA